MMNSTSAIHHNCITYLISCSTTGYKRKRSESEDADKKNNIIWTEEMETFLLKFYHQQLKETVGEKTLKNGSWTIIANCMTANFGLQIVKDTSGLGEDNDDTIWKDIILKNRYAANFRDGSTFRHYDRMAEIFGDNLFDGNEMSSVTSLAESADNEIIEVNEIDTDIEIAATIIGNQIAAFSSNITNSLRTIANAMTVTPQGQAMEFFRKPPLDRMLEDRVVRNEKKEMRFLNEERNARLFLGCEDLLHHRATIWIRCYQSKEAFLLLVLIA